MIYGVGIDLVEIKRVDRLCKDTDFINRFFTAEEAKYIKKNGANSAAGIFASKEAFSKSIGTGIKGFALADVEINHDRQGKPFITLYKSIKSDCDQKGLAFFLSITHTSTTAGAVVVAVKI